MNGILKAIVHRPREPPSIVLAGGQSFKFDFATEYVQTELPTDSWVTFMMGGQRSSRLKLGRVDMETGMFSAEGTFSRPDMGGNSMAIDSRLIDYSTVRDAGSYDLD